MPHTCSPNRSNKPGRLCTASGVDTLGQHLIIATGARVTVRTQTIGNRLLSHHNFHLPKHHKKIPQHPPFPQPLEQTQALFIEGIERWIV